MNELSFVATACFVGELEDSDTFVIAFADNAENPQHTFELQRPLEGKGYSTVLTSGAVFEGGIEGFDLQDNVLTLHYAANAQQVLQVSRIQVTLDLDPMVVDRVRAEIAGMV